MPKNVIDKFKEDVTPCAIGEEVVDERAIGISDLNRVRTNKFSLVIDLPACFKHLDTTSDKSNRLINLSKLEMNVWGTVTPQIQVPSMEVPYSGGVIKVSSHTKPAYDPVSVDFTVDHSFINYQAIYAWLDIMADDTTLSFDAKSRLKAETTNLKTYSTTWTLFALNEYNEKLAFWDFWGAYPTQLGEIAWTKREPVDLESQLTFEFSFMKFGLVTS